MTVITPVMNIPGFNVDPVVFYTCLVCNHKERLVVKVSAEDNEVIPAVCNNCNSYSEKLVSLG